MIFLRILIFVALILVGLLILKYTVKIVDTVGHSGWADRYLGMGVGGGSYNMWKLIGIIVIIIGIVILVKGLGFLGY
ncbi:MAG: hypothetical protein NT135_02145 [Candidatus Berkelbacteria bacterium]|nr:hypothetical protein [Candidatus Berkelbacteria bacterium]